MSPDTKVKIKRKSNTKNLIPTNKSLFSFEAEVELIDIATKDLKGCKIIICVHSFKHYEGIASANNPWDYYGYYEFDYSVYDMYGNEYTRGFSKAEEERLDELVVQEIKNRY